MAERRMFAKTIIDSDAFLDMPVTAQLLYFHMAMRADDDGFVNKPRSIMRVIGARDDDAKVLIAKKFILPFDSGVIVIKHWRIHNYIRSDRYVETKYKDEKNTLSLDENNAYTTNASGIPCGNQMATIGIPSDNQMDTQVRLEIDQISTDKRGASDDAAPKKFTRPTLDVVTAYFKEINGTPQQAEQFMDYYCANGWKIGGKAPMKDWRASARNWVRRDLTPATTNAAKASGRVVDRTEHSGHDILQHMRPLRLKREE